MAIAPERASDIPRSDAFTMQNSGFNAFLFSEVGAQQNGLELTVLSVLARLDRDPWLQAAEWSRMPHPATIACLTDSITRMPLCQSDLADARMTSERLVMLLPHDPTVATKKRQTFFKFKTPEWLPLAIFCVTLGLAVAAGTFAAPPPASTPITQTIEIGQAVEIGQ
jgi:hypothetical protein